LRDLDGRFDGFFELARKGIHRTARCSPPTVVIHHRVAKQPVKPGDDRFAIVHGLCALHSFHEGLLQDVLRLRPVADAPLQKSEELSVIGHQFIDDGGRKGKLRRVNFVHGVEL
jgi:hypothetical protein